MISSSTTCPITDKPITGLLTTPTYFQYSLNYNKHIFEIRLSTITDWDSEKTLKPEQKIILNALLHNNEWPLEKETIITQGLVNQLMRFAEYPKDFDEKLNYYILKCYLGGGNRYRPIEYDEAKWLDMYAKDKDEFNGLINAMVKKGLITMPDKIAVLKSNENKKLELTEKGVQLGKELNLAKDLLEPKRYSGKGPRVTVVSDKEDQFYSQILSNLLLDEYGMTVISNSGLDSKEDGYSEVVNLKSRLYSDEINYVVFVKSEASDRNNVFGSILDIAIEAHQNTAKRDFNYLFFAFVDDSDFNSRPRLLDYNNESMEFRITTNRKRLVKYIQDDWNARTNHQVLNANNIKREFNFPKIELKPEEIYWLKLIYQNFITGKEEYYENFISKHWDKLPTNFNPTKINHMLLSGGSNITFYGIWMVDPTSKYVKELEDLIFAIKEILHEEGNPEDITDVHIQKKVNIPIEDITRVLTLVSRFDGLANFASSKDDGKGVKIKIRGGDQLNLYQNFTSLEQLFYNTYWSKHIEKTTSSDGTSSGRLLNKIIDFKNIHSFKSKISYRDKNNIRPVMGAIELAQDMSAIINNLSMEKEKGQMVGIFGKWGRGKTFLLNEIWQILQHNLQPKYVRLEFQAWKYQETPASWAYLYEIFAKEYLGKKGFRYYFRLFALNIKRNGIWPALKFGLFFIFFITGTILIPGLISKYPNLDNWYSILGAYSLFGVSVISILSQIHKEFNVKATDLIKKYSLKHTFKDSMGIQADIQDELIKLLKVWIPKGKLDKNKIILFVEDIDRCSEEKIISNIDALRILLEDDEISKRVIIITAIDERILKNAIKVRYNSILDDSENNDVELKELISEYLDKLFISAVKLGSLSTDQRNEYIGELLRHEIGDEKLNELRKQDTKKNIFEKLRQSISSDEVLENMSTDQGYLDMQESIKLQENLMKQFGEDYLDLAVKDGDFVEKDGDIALEDKDGKIISMPELEKTYNERMSKQNQFEKLSDIEIKMLITITGGWTSATPRRVRIFYYRYLLCKNLLISKYDGLKRLNVWQNKEGINALMFTLLEYTKAHDPDAISVKKKEHLESTIEEIDIIINSEDLKIYRVDYLYLLEILELIIAY